MTTTAPEGTGAVLATAFSWRVLETLGEESARAILDLWVSLRTEVSESEFVELVVARLVSNVLAGHAIGRAYAEYDRGIYVNGQAIVPESVGGYEPVPDGFEQRGALLSGPGREIDVEETEERLTKAVTALLNANIARIERIARDEPIEAAQRGYQDGLIEQTSEGESAARGYRRGINPDACQLCFWLWKEGYVYPITQPMHRHKGCRCWPIPTTDRLGYHELSDADQQLLDALYEKHSTRKRGKAS